jgi:hypothetical protein
MEGEATMFPVWIRKEREQEPERPALQIPAPEYEDPPEQEEQEPERGYTIVDTSVA